MDTGQVHAETVVGIFPDDPTARDAVAGLAERGIPRDAIGVLAAEGDGRPAAAARQVLLTGAALGGVGAALLEATILSFPPATVFIAGGTLVAALAGLSVGAGAGAAAGALMKVGVPHTTARRVESTLTGTAGRVLVSVTSSRRDVRERARLLMRVQGAVETHDPDDDSSDTHFATGFVSVVPELKQHLRERDGDERRWTKLEARYRYGWQMANRPDFKERSWDDAVADLRSDWRRRHAAVPWSEAAPFIERGWRAAQATTRETTRT
jgi:hypothetical protein